MRPSQIGQLDHTIILCRRMPETRTFYGDVLGLAIAEERANWVSFQVGATLLTLRPRGVWSVCDDGPLPAGSAALQLAFRVPREAVDGWHADLLAKGVPILRGPTDLPQWRHRTLFFRDPEENIIELYAEY
ncbi:glyoxalase/bleomycin resistance/dioxygenase family protein [Roseomonas terrae]|jgi:catechol 2,3-dioxygenase-like lactoylglutathione lyase family enzyme|uniref:Glyoxalase/bleomycin resistance/dioxygenase family protein n=1 Tax=Neoroseomonas terrae TaxID=424799 RepID=A0ABS5EM05_9PROT|nr:VOC family protein [Neoroseomonas terrae]MBR0652042.1 glyoxalase/bleomycin resistance/dioxygenase family protein [Neoroseomonas terrae]